MLSTLSRVLHSARETRDAWLLLARDKLVALVHATRERGGVRRWAGPVSAGVIVLICGVLAVQGIASLRGMPSASKRQATLRCSACMRSYTLTAAELAHMQQRNNKYRCPGCDNYSASVQRSPYSP